MTLKAQSALLYSQVCVYHILVFIILTTGIVLCSSEPKPAHDILRDKILGKAEAEHQRKLAEEERRAEEERSKHRQDTDAYLDSVNDDWGSSPTVERRYDPSNEAEDEVDRREAREAYEKGRLEAQQEADAEGTSGQGERHRGLQLNEEI
jgi:hypothetical protein